MIASRRTRLAGIRHVEAKLAEILNPTLGSLKMKKTKELGGLAVPDANIPKVVSFPTS